MENRTKVYNIIAGVCFCILLFLYIKSEIGIYDQYKEWGFIEYKLSATTIFRAIILLFFALLLLLRKNNILLILTTIIYIYLFDITHIIALRELGESVSLYTQAQLLSSILLLAIIIIASTESLKAKYLNIINTIWFLPALILLISHIDNFIQQFSIIKTIVQIVAFICIGLWLKNIKQTVSNI